MKRWLALCLCALFTFPLWSCTQKESSTDQTPDQLLESMKAAVGEENLPMLQAGDETLLQSFYGLSPDDLTSYAWEFAAINVRADEFFVAQVKEGRMDAVRSAVEKRQADLESTWKQYLPEVYDTVKQSRTVEKGDFILYVVSPQADEAVAAFEKAF